MFLGGYMMLESMSLGFSVVFPLVVYMLVGYVAKRRAWLSVESFEQVNKLIFRVFMAALLFHNTYTMDKASAFSMKNLYLLLFALVCLAAVYVVSHYLGEKVIRDKNRAAVICQGIFRSNLALFGLPVSLAIYGEGRQGDLALLMAIIVPIYNILAEIVLSEAGAEKPSIKDTFQKILHNPLVVCGFSGLAFALFEIKLPSPLAYSIDRLGKVATPLAFVVIGGSLAIKNFHADRKAITWTSVLRLLVLPACILPVSYALGFRETALVALLVVFGSPISVSSYTMARDKNIAPALAGELVAVTTFASIATIFFWITVLNALGLI